MSERSLTAFLPKSVYDVVRQASNGRWEDALPYGYSEQKSPNYWVGRGGRGVRCVVWHIADGTGLSALGWLRDPGSEVSSNDLILESGEVVLLVDGANTPWTNGRLNAPRIDFPIVLQTVAQGVNPNRVSYTIECAGKSSLGRGGSLTEFQQASLIVRTAQACMVHRLTADADHILRHASWDSVNRANCPGFSKAEMVAWVEAVNWLTTKWRGW